MGGCSGALLLLASCAVHLATAAGEERAQKDVCDLGTDAMVRVLACINQTANDDVGLVITKFRSNDAFLTRALCGAGYNIDSLLHLFFTDDFMEELMTAEKKCLRDAL
ncbi:uncharacterized protein LOC144118351 [Amblyomma americanum]